MYYLYNLFIYAYLLLLSLFTRNLHSLRDIVIEAILGRRNSVQGSLLLKLLFLALK